MTPSVGSSNTSSSLLMGGGGGGARTMRNVNGASLLRFP